MGRDHAGPKVTSPRAGRPRPSSTVRNDPMVYSLYKVIEKLRVAAGLLDLAG